MGTRDSNHKDLQKLQSDPKARVFHKAKLCSAPSDYQIAEPGRMRTSESGFVCEQCGFSMSYYCVDDDQMDGFIGSTFETCLDGGCECGAHKCNSNIHSYWCQLRAK